MSRAKLLTAMLLIVFSTAQAFTPGKTWYGPFVAAIVIIALTALLQKSEPGDEL